MNAILKSAAAPIAIAVALLVAACAETRAPSASQTKSQSQSATLITAQGGFVGDNDHVVTGGATVSRVDGQWVITLDENFSLDGAPDPKVALGDGGYVEGTILGKLESLKGRQSYALKAGLDIGDYNEVWIWCERFNVALGHAKLTLL